MRVLICLLVGSLCLLSPLCQCGELHSAVLSGDLDEVETMLDHAPHLLEVTDEYGCTPLHEAALLPEGHVAQYLISYGANVNARDADDRTALHYASSDGYMVIVRLLLENNADPFAKSTMGETPIHLAARRAWQSMNNGVTKSDIGNLAKCRMGYVARQYKKNDWREFEDEEEYLRHCFSSPFAGYYGVWLQPQTFCGARPRYCPSFA